MRFFLTLAIFLCCVSLKADPWTHIEGLALEKMNDSFTESVLYQTLETFYETTETNVMIDADILCVQEIYEDRDAEALNLSQ